MPKAKVKDILTYATENKFGVAAINTLNIETVKYVIEAAERERVPIIVQFYPGFSDYTDLKYLALQPAIWQKKHLFLLEYIWIIL